MGLFMSETAPIVSVLFPSIQQIERARVALGLAGFDTQMGDFLLVQHAMRPA